MNAHECDFWITPTGALECACGASRRPMNDNEENPTMTNPLDREMAKLAAMGITVSTKLANPNADTPARRIRDAAEAHGIAYGSTDRLPAPKLTPEQLAEVERFGIHEEDKR